MSRASKILEPSNIEDKITELTKLGWKVISKSEPDYQSIVLQQGRARLTMFRLLSKAGDEFSRATLKDGTSEQESLIHRLFKNIGWAITFK